MPKTPNIPLSREENEFFEQLRNNPFFAGEKIEVTFDSNGKRDLQIANVRGVFVLSSPFPVHVNVSKATSKKCTVVAQPSWEFLERKEIKATTTSFDFGSVLDNRVDCNYRIEGYWLAAAQAGSYGLKLRVNGTDSPSLSNEGQSYVRGVTAGAAAGTGTGLAVAAVASTSTEEVYFDATMRFHHGEQKLLQSVSNSTWGTTTGDNSVGVYAGKWEDTGTVITSLGLVPTYSSSILSGSEFSLYRKPELNNTKVTLWVY